MADAKIVFDRHAEIIQRDHVQRLALGLHDVGELHETWLVEPQIHRDDGGQVDFDGFQAGVHFPDHGGGISV